MVLNFTPANAILTNEEFYVGVALMGDGVNKFYPIAVQPESPVRPGTFYSTGNAYDGGATTTFGSTSVKPMIEAITSNAVLNSNITTVNAVYALGKNPLALGAGEIMQAVITNDGETIMNNVPVSLAISGANTFASAQTIVKLGAGQSATVSFGAFTATAKGTNIITVTSNNETAKALSINQVITDGIFSYANEAPRTSNYGASNGDIIFLVKHSLTGTKKIKAVRLRIGSNAANTGKSIYAVLTDGNGNVVAQSDSYIIQSADLDTDKDFLLQTPTTITNQNFMVGIALETAQQFYPIGVQTENPARTGAYYTRARTSNTLTLSSALYRYMISAITEDEVLPVTISSFTAKLNNNKVNLSWTVGIETNVNRYVVERSQNGTDFISVAEVAANGSSNYAALDVKPELGVNYYRLKGVDNDGTISPFNELRSVKVISLAVQEAQIYPNPLVGNTLKVSLVNYIKGTYNYKLTNVAGKVIQKGSFDHNGSEGSSIAFNSQLPKGVYVLQIVHGSEVIQSKLVKQ
ncbi:T9SS type A sorting domain-containing protein [Pedobacter sp.]|uniref:T9SS type A sorting domain-containing protein n=1 Tax=Pedobacter sp. TaxID=1411316 RepID=UPI00396C9DE5